MTTTHLLAQRFGGTLAAQIRLWFPLREPLGNATFTGAAQGIAPVNGADFVTLDYFNMHSGTGPVTAHDLIVGWSTDETITDDEIAGGATSDTNSITIPAGTVPNQHQFIWRADADGGDPNEVHIAGAGNSRNSYGVAVARTVDGTPGQLIFSGSTFSTSLLEGETLRVV